MSDDPVATSATDPAATPSTDSAPVPGTGATVAEGPSRKKAKKSHATATSEPSRIPGPSGVSRSEPLFNKWFEAAKIGKSYRKNDILAPGGEVYLPHVKMSLAPRSQDEEKELLAERVAEIMRQHAYSLNTLSNIIDLVLPGGEIIPDEYLYLGRLEREVMKTVRSCKRALKFQNRTRLQYENALRLKFDVLFLNAIDEARDVLKLEMACDQAEYITEFEYMVQTCGLNMSANARCDAAFVSFHDVPACNEDNTALTAFIDRDYMAYHKQKGRSLDYTVVLCPLIFFEAKYVKDEAFQQLCMAMHSSAHQMEALGVKEIYLLGVAITAKPAEISFFSLIWEKPDPVNQVYPRLFQTLRFTDAKETRLALVLIFRFLRAFIKPQQEKITQNINAMSKQELKS